MVSQCRDPTLRPLPDQILTPSPAAGLLSGTPPTGARWRPPAGNPGDPQFWRPVDSAYEQILQEERARDPWLLLQTMATGVPRRALYSALGVRAGWRVLDAGTGFAPVAVEMAGAFGCQVVGVDYDRDQLERAAATTDALRAIDWLQTHSAGMATSAATVSFAAALVGGLPFGEGIFDAVVARFLLQHVADPSEAIAELVRVTKPGGVVCIIDVDDGLCLSHPGPPEPVRRLEAAYQQAQQERGGNRMIGRKIPGMLDAAGVAVGRVLVLPQAAYGRTSPADWSQRLLHIRLSTFAEEIVGRGLLDEATANEALHQLATEEMPATTVVDMHLAVIGHRRP